MTVLGLFWANRLTYLLSVVAFSIFAVLAHYAYGPLGPAFVAVAFTVMLLRDIGYYRRAVATWPIVREVLDWNRVEHLANLTD